MDEIDQIVDETISESKSDLIKALDKLAILKMQNIDGVDIVFDGDEAGQTAADSIKTMADRLGLISRNVNLGDHIDPGALAASKVQELRERLYSS